MKRTTPEADMAFALVAAIIGVALLSGLLFRGAQLVAGPLAAPQGVKICNANDLDCRPAVPPASVECTHYVEPDWGGTASGTASQPWTSLASGQWTTINTALASGPVYVCFSARAAGSDVDETSSTQIHISRTNTSTNLLTLDGMSKYNTNDSAPVWVDYPTRTQTVTLLDSTVVTGRFYNGSRFFITDNNPIDTTQVKNSYVTVRGFRLVSTANQALWYWNGYHVIIEHNDMSSSGGGVGPGVYFVGQREEVAVSGNGGACVNASYQNCDGFENLTVRYNYVHETRGEGIYFGGVGDQSSPGVAAKQQTYLIEDNMVVNASYLQGEGDAIDVKTMITGVTIRGNYIKFTAAGGGTPRACTETLSGIVYERNYCDGGGLTAMGLSLTDFWSQSASNRPGSIVRNNIFVRIAGTRAAIQCWGDTTGADDFTGMVIDNNTTYIGTNGIYLGVNCTGATVRNNVLSSSSGVTLSSSPALSTHSNNIFHKTSGNLITVNGSSYTSGTLTTYEATALSSDPLFVNTTVPDSPEDYKIQSGSPAIDAGVTIGTFSDDLFGTSRPQGASWDRGAHERP